jgi:hypothetical protein
MLTRMSVILTLTKVIMTLVSVKTTLCVQKSLLCVIFTRILWNYTRTSVISERKVWYQPAQVWFIYVECDFHTQSVISERRV